MVGRGGVGGGGAALLGRQLTLGIIKPDILVPSLPALFRRRTPNAAIPRLTVDALLRHAPHRLLLPSPTSSTSPSTLVTPSPSLSYATRVAEDGHRRRASTFLMDLEEEATSCPPQASDGESTTLEEILKMITAHGFDIVESRFMEMSIDEAEQFYGEHEGRFFYQRLVAFMTSGPIVPLILAKQDAIAQWRALMGPTHIRRARTEAPNTIRGRFAASDTRNSTHGSDSVESARREMAFFFPGIELPPAPP